MNCSSCGSHIPKQSDVCEKCEMKIEKSMESADALMTTDGITQEELKLFIGDKWEPYFKKWKIAEKGKPSMSWHWAGFIFGVFWLGYRKIYGYLIGFFVSFVVIDLMAKALNINVSSIVISVLLAFTANLIYYNHTRKKILKIKKMHQDAETQKIEIAKAGGVSWVGVGLAILLLIIYGCFSFAINSSAPTTPQQQAQAPALSSGAQQPEQPKQNWNTTDMDIMTNGNIAVALKVLKPLTINNILDQAESPAPASVMKAPWKYYGKVIKITGLAVLAQDYPPGSDIGKVFGGDVGEIVITTDDAAIIDYMGVGGTGDINVGDITTVYGYPVGFAEVENKLGGQTTQLLLVGKVAKKQ